MTNNQRYLIPEIDIYENDNEFYLTAEMPGVDKDGVDVNVEDDQLRIIGRVSEQMKGLLQKGKLTRQEYYLNDYRRTFNLAHSVNVANISATMDNGVLTVVLPKSESIKPRKIEVLSD